jgi:hypothetical protein
MVTPGNGDADMAKFLIEVAHDEEEIVCARVVEVFLKTGSHFLSNADWGCMDGDHRAWIVVELDSKEEAVQILPPVFRRGAKIVELNKFSLEDIEEILEKNAA